MATLIGIQLLVDEFTQIHLDVLNLSPERDGRWFCRSLRAWRLLTGMQAITQPGSSSLKIDRPFGAEKTIEIDRCSFVGTKII